MKSIKSKIKFPDAAVWAGLICLAAAFAAWWRENAYYGACARAAAVLSAALFAAICLRLVPEWRKLWCIGEALADYGGKEAEKSSGEKAGALHTELKIFLLLLTLDAGIILLVFILRRLLGDERDFIGALEFWKCADGVHYLDIARDWYLSEGSADRLVQLVFLPGYPIAVGLAAKLLGSYLVSGLVVSALCFAGAGCFLYRLMRLDFGHLCALRAVKWLRIMPGAFFFAAPMSESLFVLLSAACIYFIRTKRAALGCLLGGYAAFTRSLGIVLLVPAALEMICSLRRQNKPASARSALELWPLALICAGTAGYLLINYIVSGEPFKFMQYQSEHWGQGFGWFFSTAAYQTTLALDSFSGEPEMFFGLWLPNLLSAFSGLLIMLFAAGKLRAGYTAWFLAYFFIAIGATWLLSAPRYMLSCLPLTIALAALTENEPLDMVATLCSCVLGTLYLFAFILRWQVW